jgi:hypothetical protein
VFNVALSPDVPEGDVNDVIRIEFDDDSTSSLDVELRARKAGPFRVIPRVLTLPPFVGEETAVRHVRVMSSDGRPFRIERVGCRDNIVVSELPEADRPSVDLTLNIVGPPGPEPRSTVTFHFAPSGQTSLMIEYQWTSPLASDDGRVIDPGKVQ